MAGGGPAALITFSAGVLGWVIATFSSEDSQAFALGAVTGAPLALLVGAALSRLVPAR
jgi:hypothetical protein